MSCVTNDFTIHGDVDNRLKDSVLYVSKGIANITNVLASFFKDSRFTNYLQSQIGEKTPAEADQNTVRRVLREWLKKEYPTVGFSAARVNGDTLQGFSSSRAKSLAINYTADLLNQFDYQNRNNPREKRISDARVVNAVINRIRKNFINDYAKPAYDRYKETHGAIEDIEKLESDFRKLQTYLDQVVQKYGAKIPAEIGPQYNKVSAVYKEVLTRLNNQYLAFIANNGNIREKNFANMVEQIITNPKEWMQQALSLKKSLAIAKKYGYTITGEDLSYYISEDDINITENDSEGLNEESRRFLDEIDKYKSFLQLVSDDVRQYISSLVNYSSLKDDNGKDNPVIDTDNELGVATRMNTGFVINNIMARCNFADGIPGLIKSLEQLISNKPQLYGLQEMINKMKTDNNFARSIFHGLGNPLITKTMIDISNKLDFRQSNRESNARLSLTFTMLNQMKSTVRGNYTIDAQDAFNSIRTAIKNNKLDFAERALKKYILNYFPGIDINTFTSFIENGDKKTNLNQLNAVLEEFNRAAGTLIDQMNKKKYGDLDFRKNIDAIGSIVDLILPYTVVNTELNSANAEGNMSSDVLNNNNITNLINQIKYATEKDANAGLKLLKDFVVQSPQYKHSPIFFGVYDTDGTEIFPGLFYRDGNDVHINPAAKTIIRTSLFNGITNPITGENALYSNMSEADYFVSSLVAFTTQYRDYNTPKLNFLDAAYFLRVPSDAPKNFLIHAPRVSSYGLLKDGVIDKDHAMYKVYKQILLNEINTFVENLNNVFEYKNGEWVVKKNKRGLFSNYHYNGDIITVDKNGNYKLSGKVFDFLKLHATTNIDVDAAIKDVLSLYGQENGVLISKDGRLNLNRTDIIKIDANNEIKLADNFDIDINLNGFLENYFKDVINDALIKKDKFKDIIGDRFEDATIIDMVLNTNAMYTVFDDLFEGDAKFYKNAQTFLKRAKEVQAGGMAYDNWTVGDKLGGTIQNVQNNGKLVTYEVAGRTIIARTGFRAITINNTIRPSDEANNIRALLKAQNVNKDTIEDIVKRFAGDTTTNDAQSYITIDELANRLFAKGELSKYKPLLDKFLTKDEAGNPLPVSEEDLKELAKLGEKIQVQKNFYFDKQFDTATKTTYPRQIKNAEFVLIPQLLAEDSSLRKLYDLMVKHDIGQVNTAETDKAAKRYVLDFWDADGVVSDKAFKAFELELTNGAAVENYYYRYLYEQQQVAQHMENEQNKAGIQIMKKIIDNANHYSPAVQAAVKKLFDNYCANIQDSFNTMMDNMGWKVDESGNIVNKDGTRQLSFTEFYKRGREEAKRLGMDSQFMAYFDVDENGNAILPNFMNNIQTKFESIAQAMFNSAITRQKLPGWHAAQITNVGFDSKLHYHKSKNTNKNLLKDDNGNILKVYRGYSSNNEIQEQSVLNTFNKTRQANDYLGKGIHFTSSKDTAKNYAKVHQIKTNEKYTHVNEYYIDTTNAKIEYYDSYPDYLKAVHDKEGNFIKDSDADIIILKKDTLGQNNWEIKVVNESFVKNANNIENTKSSSATEIRLTPWFNMDIFKGKTNEEILAELKEVGLDKMIIYRIPTEGKQSISISEVVELLNPTQGSTVVVADEWVTQTGSDFDVDSVYGIQYVFARDENGKLYKVTEGRDGRNNAILDAMIEIMSDPTVIEENLSCSNFDEISDEISFFNEVNPEINAANQSTYDIFDQMTFMNNATSGMALKATSVVRDNFNSINSYVGTEIPEKYGITIEYDLTKYDLQTIKDAYDNVDTTTKPGYAIVTHTRLANSKNNRNVKGRLITVYSSQTTAHILDAIKTGAIFNENQYTFGAFKTLIDLGIDYHTAIAFLQQPAMTMIVNNYNKNKSVYSEENNYFTKPINDTLRELAVIAGVKVNNKDITATTSMKSIKDALVANTSLQEAYKKLFGAKLSFEKDTLFNYISLNANQLINRLKQGRLSQTGNNPNITNLYETVAYDLGMTMFYHHLQTVTQGIEENARVSNPDKFGALQTVATTRKKLDKIIEILNSPVGPNTLLVGNKHFLDAIYPGIRQMKEDGGYKDTIDISKSAYPYLAAFVKYSTIPSVNVNAELFYLEHPMVNHIFKAIEQRIGKSLTEDQQKEYKQYVTTMIYNNVPMLTTPLTIDAQGRIIEDTKLIEEQAAENNPKYWNLERNRLLGYRVLEDYNFEVKDLYNPTDEELRKFNLLTPVQKINFIKKNYFGDPGIFSYLETNTFKNETTIRYKEVTDDIETLYRLMNEAFFNTDKFIRLAAVDLVKYGLINEAGKFKKGSVAKLITKEILLAGYDNYGLDLVNQILDSYEQLKSFDMEFSSKIIDRFIRSHHNIVDTVKINKNSPINKYFRNFTYIINTDDKEACKFIKWNKNNNRRYIKLSRKFVDETGREIETTNLYKIEDAGRCIYVYPLNTLNTNEITEYSMDIVNNPRHKSELYYSLYFDTGRTDINTFMQEYKEEDLRVINNKIETTVSDTAIVDKLESSSKVESTQANQIIADITDIVRLPVKGVYTGLISNDAYWLHTLIPRGKSIKQKIVIDGIERTIYITPIRSKRLENAITKGEYNTDIRNGLSAIEQNVYDKIWNRGYKRLSLYGLTIADENERSGEDVLDKAEFAASRSFIGSDNQVHEVNPTLGIAESILKDIAHFERVNDVKFNDSFMNDLQRAGIDTSTMEAIDNNLEKIFSFAAAYYNKLGIELLKRADKFQLADGREFSIDDPALYEALSEELDLDVLAKLLMDIRNFGNNIKGIMLLQPTSTNLAMQKDIKSITNIIHKVSNNQKMLKGFEHMFNTYYKKHSSNPMIKNGIIELREAFGDIHKADMLIADIHELANNQVQTVVKYIDNRIKRVERTEIPKARKAFANRFDDIMRMTGPFNWDNVVTKDGFLVRDYTDEFFTKRAQLSEAVKNATPNTIEYYKAKLERDKWLAKNTHRAISYGYYSRVNQLTQDVIDKAPDLYVEYMKLVDQLQEISVDNNLDTEDKIKARRYITEQMSQLASIYDTNLNEKNDADKEKAKALAKFIKYKQELNKEVFQRTATKEFNDQFEYHTKQIEAYDAKYPNRPLSAKLNDENYANSYNWIQTNTIRQLNETSRQAIQEAFAITRKDAEEVPNYVKHILKGKDVYTNGKLDPSKISLEDAKAIKEAKEAQFEENEYNPLMKNTPKNKPAFRKEYWDELKVLSELEGGTNNETSIINEEINQILKKVCKTGQDITVANLIKLSVEDLKRLSVLYFNLQHPGTFGGGKSDVADFINTNSIREYNTDAFEAQLNELLTNHKANKGKYGLLLNILIARDETGIFKESNGKYVPNPQIFSYRVPKAAYRNTKLEAARKLLEDNVQWETTDAYRAAEDLAYVTGKYDEWFEANHYYNPYTGEYVPLPYWTEMKINPNGTLDASYEQVPTYNNTESTVRDAYKNNEYNPLSTTNYNNKTGDYNNTKNLSAKELAMRNLLQEVLDNNANNNRMRALAERGFMPRQAKEDINAAWYAKQAFGTFGIGFNYRQPDWTYDINYSSEEDVAPPMMSYLKAKGYKPLPNRADYITQDEYDNAVKEVKEHNKKLDTALLDRDWKSVFDTYIQEAMMYNEKRVLRNQAQMLIQDLKDNQAVKLNYLNTNPSVASRATEGTSENYNTEAYDNTLKVVENWYHRVFRNEYKTKSRFNNMGSLLQNITSAKYMIFNVTGGIANVLTGRVNIMAEHLAGEYFKYEDWRKAASEYASNSLTMIANQYSDKATTLTDGLIKLGNVVDFDAIIERSGNKGLAKYIERTRDKLYFMQSTGEHIMQNTVFLAMLHSNRVWADGSGYGTLEQYILKREEEIFTNLIATDPNLVQLFKNFKDIIKIDTKLRYQYSTYRKNYINDFIKAHGGRALQEKYNAARKTARKTYESEFNNLDTVYNQFELVDGYARIKANSAFTNDMFADIINKTISVNKRIHGVYDKIGAAYIERYWWGTLIIQYHKHIYPLLKKLYRRKGYYNEIRGTIEKGAYNTHLDFFRQEFENAAEQNKDMNNIVLKAIYNTCQGAYNTAVNLRYNYDSMPDWEKANFRRGYAHYLGGLAAILAAIALHAGFDDDDFKESNTLATLLYQCDRLWTESLELHPIGIKSAIKTTWSSPIASINGPQDLYETFEIFNNMIFDDEFDWDYTTGRYKGQNKLLTKIGRNVPIYRIYDRLSGMAKSNKYYRIGNNTFAMKFAKSIGNTIQGEE